MPAVSVELFRKSALLNLNNYPRCLKFWWPIIDARAERYQLSTSADDLLLNPVFRWIFLDRSHNLEAFENRLSKLEDALGMTQLRAFHDQLLQDISKHKIENNAHNRLLSAMVEVRAVLRFSADGYNITLVPLIDGQNTPDFKADKKQLSRLVEVKYIRPPDKLDEYLLRWWQAKKELTEPFLQVELPHLMSEWDPVASRSELTMGEIASLKSYFETVYQQPELDRDLSIDRLFVRYNPDHRLPITIETLPERAAYSEANREGIFKKIDGICQHALSQLGVSEKAHQRTIFLGINLSADIQFFWNERFEERLETRCAKFLQKGVEVIVEKVGYL